MTTTLKSRQLFLSRSLGERQELSAPQAGHSCPSSGLSGWRQPKRGKQKESPERSNGASASAYQHRTSQVEFLPPARSLADGQESGLFRSRSSDSRAELRGRTTRRPTFSLRLAGSFALRLPERQLTPAFCQLPPRSTRGPPGRPPKRPGFEADRSFLIMRPCAGFGKTGEWSSVG